MTVREVLRAIEPLGRELPESPALEVPCAGVTYDSRRVEPGTVFVALRGAHADGAAFAPAAVAHGAVAVVAEHPPATPIVAPWIAVSDARLALARLADAYFEHPSHELAVVGVTGTNGKTTTSYLLHAIYEAAGVATGLIGTVATRVGRSVRESARTTPEAPELQSALREMVREGCGACVMEVSSHALALKRADAVRFAAGVFTNLTRDHLDFHGDMDAYFVAKRRLFELLPHEAPAVINVDDPRAAALLDVAGRPVTYGMVKPADVTPGPVAYSLDGLAFDVRTPQGTVHVQSSLVGKPNVHNILGAVGTAAALGVSLAAIERGVRQLRGVPGRFELVSTPFDDIAVFVDYAHTDDALRNLLETARPMASRHVTTVFGAGGSRDRTKRPLMGMVAARLSNTVVITSDNPRDEDPARIIEEIRLGADAEARKSGTKIVTIADRREAVFHAIRSAEAGDIVLIAGKGHETYQEVGGQRLHYDDCEVAREALAARRVKSRVG